MKQNYKPCQSLKVCYWIHFAQNYGLIGSGGRNAARSFRITNNRIP